MVNNVVKYSSEIARYLLNTYSTLQGIYLNSSLEYSSMRIPISVNLDFRPAILNMSIDDMLQNICLIWNSLFGFTSQINGRWRI